MWQWIWQSWGKRTQIVYMSGTEKRGFAETKPKTEPETATHSLARKCLSARSNLSHYNFVWIYIFFVSEINDSLFFIFETEKLWRVRSRQVAQIYWLLVLMLTFALFLFFFITFFFYLFFWDEALSF